MKILKRNMIFALALIIAGVSGCQKQYEMGELKTPTDVTLTYDIVGVDENNPYGDGSGLVNISVSANNAITYNIDFDDGRDNVIVPSGNITYQFTINGVNTYNVTVQAVGTGGISSSFTTQIEVLSNFQDEEALEFLTGGSSKTWYWAADQAAHTALGPTNEDYGNLEFTWPAWWQIGAWDDDKACMYEAEFVFTKVGNGMTFEQTKGPAFIPGTYAEKIGVEGDVCHGEDVVPNLYGVKNVAFLPSSSNAAEAGGYRGTSMSFSGQGVMCWWVGKSEYDIIEVTDNILRVRIKEDETYAWYHIFTSTRPEQK